MRSVARLLLAHIALFVAATLASAQPAGDAPAPSAGIRKIAGKHLLLYTDLESDPEIDRLPAVFDQAVPQ